MKTFTMNQVQTIMQWSEPTARAYMKEWGHKAKSPLPPYPERWEVDNLALLERIKQDEALVMDMKSRYHAELRKQEAQSCQ